MPPAAVGARAPATCSRTTSQLCMPKVSSISDSTRVPLGFGWTPEHSALWPTPKNARTGKLRLTNVHPLLQQGPPIWRVLPRQRVLDRVLSFRALALLRASPPTVAPFRETVPSARSAETKVVSTANWAPLKSSKPSTTLPNAGHRDGSGLGGGRVPSQARSSSPFSLPRGKPLRRLTPMQTLASPTLLLWRTLEMDSHGGLEVTIRQTAKDVQETATSATASSKRQGKARRRRKRRRRKGWESKRVSLVVGKLENSSPAMGPPWDHIRARSGSVSWRRNSSRPFFSNTADAGRCHPWFGTVSTISSSGFGRFGLAPCANASQLGRFQPLLGITDSCD